MTRRASNRIGAALALSAVAFAPPLAAQQVIFDAAILKLEQDLRDGFSLRSGILLFSNPAGRNIKSYEFRFDAGGNLSESSVSRGAIAVTPQCQQFGEVQTDYIEACGEAARQAAADQSGVPIEPYRIFYIPSAKCPSPKFYGMGFGYIQECRIAGPIGKGYYYFTYANPNHYFAFMPLP